MDIITERQLETAVEIAHSLFERGKVSGSTANISIRIEIGRASCRERV